MSPSPVPEPPAAQNWCSDCQRSFDRSDHFARHIQSREPPNTCCDGTATNSQSCQTRTCASSSVHTVQRASIAVTFFPGTSRSTRVARMAPSTRRGRVGPAGTVSRAKRNAPTRSRASAACASASPVSPPVDWGKGHSLRSRLHPSHHCPSSVLKRRRPTSRPFTLSTFRLQLPLESSLHMSMNPVWIPPVNPREGTRFWTRFSYNQMASS